MATFEVEEVDKLFKRLDTVRSSGRAQKTDTQDIFSLSPDQAAKQIFHELPFVEDLNCGLPRGRKNAAKRRRQAVIRKEFLEVLPFACDLDYGWSDSDAYEKALRLRRVAAAKQVASMPRACLMKQFLTELPFAWDPLPSPAPEKRPCWESPILNYAWYEQLLQADKKITRRDGHKDIAFRTDMLDSIIEHGLLRRYWNFAYSLKKAARDCGDWQEEHFWHGLSRALREDTFDLEDGEGGGDEIVRRHGKAHGDWTDVLHRIVEVAREKNAVFSSRDRGF